MNTKMTSSELPRLLRPQPPEFFGDRDVLAMLDADNNIVHYRADLIGTAMTGQLLISDLCKEVMFLSGKYLYIEPATTGFI
jgi:hypothetical protein